MTISVHTPAGPRPIVHRALVVLVALATAVVIATISVTVTLLVVPRSAGGPSVSLTQQRIGDDCPSTRPGQPC